MFPVAMGHVKHYSLMHLKTVLLAFCHDDKIPEIKKAPKEERFILAGDLGNIMVERQGRGKLFLVRRQKAGQEIWITVLPSRAEPPHSDLVPRTLRPSNEMSHCFRNNATSWHLSFDYEPSRVTEEPSHNKITCSKVSDLNFKDSRGSSPPTEL